MNNSNSKKVLLIIIAALIIVGALFMYKKQNSNTEVSIDNQEQVENPTEGQTPDVKVETVTISPQQQAEVDKLFATLAQQQMKMDLNSAKLTIEKILKITPNDPNMMQIYASTLYNLGDKANASIWIDKAIVLNSKNINYWYTKIEFKKAEYNNNYSLMAPIYTEAIKKTGNDFNMVTAYAQFLGMIGKKTEAITEWQKAIGLNPSSKSIYQAEIDALKK